MPDYDVVVTRTERRSTPIVVSAMSAADAEEFARGQTEDLEYTEFLEEEFECEATLAGEGE